MLPNFLIIGAPRAGTTWAARNLMTHPEIFMPKMKEVHFFDLNYAKGIDHYKTFFETGRQYKCIGEATPDYMYDKSIPKLIHEHLPDTKIIAILRNPVDRLYSRYWNAKSKYSQNRNLTFEDKIRQKPLFIEEGFYDEHLTRYLKYFDRNNILVLFFDDLKKDPDQFLIDIYRFLGIDETFQSPIVRHNFNTAKSKKYLAKSILLWHLQKVFRKINAHAIASYINRINENEYQPMDPKTRQWLTTEVYKEHNLELEKIVGKDLSHWNNS